MIRAALLCLALVVQASPAGAWIHGNGGGAPQPAVLCDGATGTIVSGGAGTCMTTPLTCNNGVTDDAPALVTFNTWATSFQGSHPGLIGLRLPANGQCVINSNTVRCGTLAQNTCPFYGIKNYEIDGQGAASLDVNAASSIGGGFGLLNDNTHSVRTSTANIGDTCVTATATAAGGTPDVTIFTVGQYALMTGFNLQNILNGGFGYPPNFHYYEYKKVTSVNNTTKVVCFDSALTKKYESTWPHYDSGSNVAIDQGGPATLYVIDAGWDSDAEFRNMTLFRSGNQLGAVGRHIVMRNVTWSGTNCYTISVTALWENIDSNESTCSQTGNGIEVDKLVTAVNVTRGTEYGYFFQSSSPNTFTMTNANVTTKIVGTPLVFTATGGTITDLQAGSDGYGRTNEINLTNVSLGSLEIHGASVQIIGAAAWTMSTNTLTIPNSAFASGSGNGDNLVAWAVPGTNFYWRADQENDGIAQVVDVTQDVTNTYVQISQSYPGGGFPAFPRTGGSMFVQAHPAPKFTCSGCTGSAGSIAAQWPAGSPLYSYAVNTYPGNNGAAYGTFKVWGNLTQVNMNVTNAYSGASSPFFHLSQFDNWTMMNSSLAAVSYAPFVNAKNVGNSQGTLTTSTCASGTCTGNGGLQAPDATTSWFTGTSNSGPAYSTDVSAACPGVNCPSVTVTIQTNQGIVTPPNP